MLPLRDDFAPDTGPDTLHDEFEMPGISIPYAVDTRSHRMKQSLLDACPRELYAIGRKMRYANGDSNKQLIEKAKLICRKDNLDWLLAMSLIKEIASGVKTNRYNS